MEITKSESIANLIGALIKAKGTFTRPKKDATNPFLKSKYADLGSCLEACEAPLAQNGLTLLQFPGHFVEGCLSLSTLLAHSSGEWIAGEMSIPLGKIDPQGAGSAITYARRYALCAALSLCPGDDNDGHVARKAPERDGVQQNITSGQWVTIKQACFRSGCSTLKLLAHYRVEKPSQLPAMHFEDALARATIPTNEMLTNPRKEEVPA